jgi:acyl carrier protein
MNTTAAIRKFIVANFFVSDPDSLTDDAPLLETGVMDSTGVLEVIHFVEGTFGVKLEDDEILPENLGSIGQIAAFVERKQASRLTSA